MVCSPIARGESKSDTVTEQNCFSFAMSLITVLMIHADFLKVLTVKKMSREKQKVIPKPTV